METYFLSQQLLATGSYGRSLQNMFRDRALPVVGLVWRLLFSNLGATQWNKQPWSTGQPAFVNNML